MTTRPAAPVVEAFLTHLTVERRLAANSIESYARDLSGLHAFAVAQGRDVDTLERPPKDLPLRHTTSITSLTPS